MTSEYVENAILNGFKRDVIKGEILWHGIPISTLQKSRKNYKNICIHEGTKSKTLSLHRALYFYYHHKWPHYTIDHINGNINDNRIENLRDAPYFLNNLNKQKSRLRKILETGDFKMKRNRYNFTVMYLEVYYNHKFEFFFHLTLLHNLIF